MNPSTVCNRNQCNGCMACVDVYPQKAIEIRDEIAHYNTFIKEDCCIHYNGRHRVCSNNNPADILDPRNWYQGWARQQRKHTIAFEPLVVLHQQLQPTL